MSRAATFPGDENGDVLRRMDADGDDLSIARDINYSVVFATKAGAEAFARHFEEAGLKTKVQLAADATWDVTVTKFMVPDHAAITALEEEFDRVASPAGGRNDGWGCFSQPKLND